MQEPWRPWFETQERPKYSDTALLIFAQDVTYTKVIFVIVLNPLTRFEKMV